MEQAFSHATILQTGDGMASASQLIFPGKEISLAYSGIPHYNGKTHYVSAIFSRKEIRQVMELVINFFDILLHLDTYLHEVILQYGNWTYLIFFIIIFCETGLVVTPFLPGDSLLFIAGTFCALGSLHLGWLLAILSAAAILGNTVNYAIGSYIGPRVFYMQDSRFFKKEYLSRTHAFFEKYGPMTIVIGRFLPIIRTFAPFLAGVGSMSYGRFLTYNIVGCVLWIFLFTLGGYFFGTIPLVKNNFTLVIIIILGVSLLPTLVEFVRQKRLSRKSRVDDAAEISEPTRQS